MTEERTLPTDKEVFEAYFRFPPPQVLLDLHADESLAAALPVGFKLSDVDYVLELQYLLGLQDPQNYDVDRNRVAFAVTTDGAELLADLNSRELEIFQREDGDVDTIGATVADLLKAERYSLTR